MLMPSETVLTKAMFVPSGDQSTWPLHFPQAGMKGTVVDPVAAEALASSSSMDMTIVWPVEFQAIPAGAAMTVRVVTMKGTSEVLIPVVVRLVTPTE